MTLKRKYPVWLSLSASFVVILALDPAIHAQDGERPPSRGPAFEAAEIWQVHLRISPEEYAAMQPRGGRRFPEFGAAAKPAPPPKPEGPAREVHRNDFGMDLPWVTGSVTLRSQTFKEVGIRYKGNGTIGDASRTIKKSFKIALDRFGGQAKLGGHNTINLHCGVADPSKLRETLAYALYRAAGVPAPRTAFAEVRLTVPGKYENELLGLYTVVEQVDNRFLRHHFGTDKGLLMKPEKLREFEHKGDEWSLYKDLYKPKRAATANESRRIIAFAKLVHQADDDAFRKEIGAYLDVDAYLRFLAATAFVANPDSFFVLGHNYLLYLHSTTGQLHFVPWDLDRSFANFPILGSNIQQMNLSFTHPYSGTHRLTERLLATPGVGERYQKLLNELAASCFEKGKLLKEVDAVDAAVRGLLAREAKAAEARKEGGRFGPPGMFGKPPALKTFMEKRTESLAAQLAGKSKGHVPTGGFGPGDFKIGAVMVGPMMEALDADKDGTLSKAEWLAAARKVFDACEKDKQKQANEKGIAAALNQMLPKPPADGPGRPQGGGPFPGFSMGAFLAAPIVKRADANRDGKVTREELLEAASKLFDQFDKEKTGRISEEAFSELLSDLFPIPNFMAAPRPPGNRPVPDAKKKSPSSADPPAPAQSLSPA